MKHKLEPRLPGETINNLRYADDTTLMAGSERGTKEHLDENEGGKAGLKLNIQKIKIMASGPLTSWQIEGGKVEAVTDLIFGGSRITSVNGDCSHEIKRYLLL